MWQNIMKLIMIWIKEILILIFLLWLLAYTEWLDNSFAMNNGSFCLAYCNIMQIHREQQQYKLHYSLLLDLACAEIGNVAFREGGTGLSRVAGFCNSFAIKSMSKYRSCMTFCQVFCIQSDQHGVWVLPAFCCLSKIKLMFSINVQSCFSWTTSTMEVTQV